MRRDTVATTLRDVAAALLEAVVQVELRVPERKGVGGDRQLRESEGARREHHDETPSRLWRSVRGGVEYGWRVPSCQTTAEPARKRAPTGSTLVPAENCISMLLTEKKGRHSPEQQIQHVQRREKGDRSGSRQHRQVVAGDPAHICASFVSRARKKVETCSLSNSATSGWKTSSPDTQARGSKVLECGKFSLAEVQRSVNGGDAYRRSSGLLKRLSELNPWQGGPAPT